MFEPISTLSNLVFIIFGLVVFPRSKYVGAVTILLGVASGGWHWTMQPFWHTFDFAMMYFMLLSLVNYALGSKYTLAAFLISTALIGLHFILPSHLIIAGIALFLFIILIRHYPLASVFIIVACFGLWISTNIPYLHKWDVPFWRLDVLHGISHLFAAIGITRVVDYKPTTFSELTSLFKSSRLSSLNEKTKAEFERIIDVELNPVLGNRTVRTINKQDISRLLGDIAIYRKSLAMATGVRSKLNQIFEFAAGNGIEHNILLGPVREK